MNNKINNRFRLTVQLDEGSVASPSHSPVVKVSSNQVKQFITSARHEKGQRINFDVLKRTWTTAQLVSKEVHFILFLSKLEDVNAF